MSRVDQKGLDRCSAWSRVINHESGHLRAYFGDCVYNGAQLSLVSCVDAPVIGIVRDMGTHVYLFENDGRLIGDLEGHRRVWGDSEQCVWWYGEWISADRFGPLYPPRFEFRRVSASAAIALAWNWLSRKEVPNSSR